MAWMLVIRCSAIELLAISYKEQRQQDDSNQVRSSSDKADAIHPQKVHQGLRDDERHNGRDHVSKEACMVVAQ